MYDTPYLLQIGTNSHDSSYEKFTRFYKKTSFIGIVSTLNWHSLKQTLVFAPDNNPIRSLEISNFQ